MGRKWKPKTWREAESKKDRHMREREVAQAQVGVRKASGDLWSFIEAAGGRIVLNVATRAKLRREGLAGLAVDAAVKRLVGRGAASLVLSADGVIVSLTSTRSAA